MSVQKIAPNFSIITNCPLVITPMETILTYQTASSLSTNNNVNSRPSEYYPNEYAYFQVYSTSEVPKCCSNNSLKKNINSGLYS